MSPRRPVPITAAAVGLVALSLLSCAGQRLVGGDLDGRYPGLSRAEAERLSEGHPFLLPMRGELLAVTCRWPDGEPVPLRIAAGVDPRTRELVVRAARAWEAWLGLGLAVSHGSDAEPSESPGIDVNVVGPDDQRIRGAGTTADCLVEPGSLREGRTGASAARLVSASVTLRPVARDGFGRRVELPDDSLLGAALHELGHALGFQGHVRGRHSVMVRSVDDVQYVGRGLLAGDALRDDAVAALYRLPTGSALASASLASTATCELDVVSQGAAALGLDGPYLRSGDRGALVFWRDEAGRIVGFAVDDLPAVLAEPSTLHLRGLPGTGRRVRELREASGADAAR